MRHYNLWVNTDGKLTFNPLELKDGTHKLRDKDYETLILINRSEEVRTIMRKYQEDTKNGTISSLRLARVVKQYTDRMLEDFQDYKMQADTVAVLENFPLVLRVGDIIDRRGLMIVHVHDTQRDKVIVLDPTVKPSDMSTPIIVCSYCDRDNTFTWSHYFTRVDKAIEYCIYYDSSEYSEVYSVIHTSATGEHECWRGDLTDIIEGIFDHHPHMSTNVQLVTPWKTYDLEGTDNDDFKKYIKDVIGK